MSDERVSAARRAWKVDRRWATWLELARILGRAGVPGPARFARVMVRLVARARRLHRVVILVAQLSRDPGHELAIEVLNRARHQMNTDVLWLARELRRLRWDDMEPRVPDPPPELVYLLEELANDPVPCRGRERRREPEFTLHRETVEVPTPIVYTLPGGQMIEVAPGRRLVTDGMGSWHTEPEPVASLNLDGCPNAEALGTATPSEESPGP